MNYSSKNLICVSIFCFSGCASSYSNSNLLPTNQTFDPGQYDAQRVSVEYKPEVQKETFSIGDEATVTVNGFEEFSGVYTVGADGNIFLGHIGNVLVAGKTIPEVQTEVRLQYNACCLVNPNVSIEREGQAFGKIVVDGAVNDAGVFDVDEVITLSEAIALGGGTSEFADKESVMLARLINGERKVSKVNLKDIQFAGAPNPLIYPADVIFVQDNKGRLIFKDFVKTLPLLSAIIIASSR